MLFCIAFANSFWCSVSSALIWALRFVPDVVDLWRESLPRLRRILVEQELNSVMVLLEQRSDPFPPVRSEVRDPLFRMQIAIDRY